MLEACRVYDSSQFLITFHGLYLVSVSISCIVNYISVSTITECCSHTVKRSFHLASFN